MDYFDDDDFDPAENADPDEASGAHALAWQLLQLINPGDEETALAQFARFQDATAADDLDDFQPMPVLAGIIDWQSGFQVPAQDTSAVVQALEEMVSRWNLRIDWGGDPDEEDFFADHDAASLCALAYDRLAETGYMLWSWEAEPDTVAGWITLGTDEEAMRAVAGALHINLRRGSELD